jgi:hypothetical protein
MQAAGGSATPEEMTTLQVATGSRWDALELMDALPRYRPHCVQKGRSEWVVVASADADAATLAEDLRSVVETLKRRRPLGHAELLLDDGSSERLN